MKTLLDLKAELMFAESAIKTLSLDENLPFLMYQRIALQFKLSGLVPIEPQPPVRVALPLATLLKEHGSSLTVQKFNNRAKAKGLITIKPWPHPTKAGKFKNRIEVVNTYYAQDHEISHQPIWYRDTFNEVLELLC
jgi:hypothetical protein